MTADRIGGAVQTLQLTRFTVTPSGAPAEALTPGQVPGMSLPPEIFTMPVEPTEHSSLQMTTPVTSLDAVTRNLGLESVEEALFQKEVEAQRRAPNQAVAQLALNQHLRDRALDPALRRALLQRALSYYQEVGAKRSDAHVRELHERGLTPDEVPMRGTISKGGPGSGVKGHVTDPLAYTATGKPILRIGAGGPDVSATDSSRTVPPHRYAMAAREKHPDFTEAEHRDAAATLRALKPVTPHGQLVARGHPDWKPVHQYEKTLTEGQRTERGIAQSVQRDLEDEAYAHEAAAAFKGREDKHAPMKKAVGAPTLAIPVGNPNMLLFVVPVSGEDVPPSTQLPDDERPVGFKDDAGKMQRMLDKLRRDRSPQTGMEKAEPRGGKYHARVTDADSGKHRYFYSESAYKARPDAHVRGSDVIRDRARKDILDRVGPGHGVSAQSDFGDLDQRYGPQLTTDLIKEMVGAGHVHERDGRLYPGLAKSDPEEHGEGGAGRDDDDDKKQQKMDERIDRDSEGGEEVLALDKDDGDKVEKAKSRRPTGYPVFGKPGVQEPGEHPAIQPHVPVPSQHQRSMSTARPGTTPAGKYMTTGTTVARGTAAHAQTGSGASAPSAISAQMHPSGVKKAESPMSLDQWMRLAKAEDSGKPAGEMGDGDEDDVNAKDAVALGTQQPGDAQKREAEEHAQGDQGHASGQTPPPDMKKGGPGSGVIGHTSSGKPIDAGSAGGFNPKHWPSGLAMKKDSEYGRAAHEASPKFTATDHFEAMNAHAKEARSALKDMEGATPGTAEHKEAYERAQLHSHSAKAHNQAHVYGTGQSADSVKTADASKEAAEKFKPFLMGQAAKKVSSAHEASAEAHKTGDGASHFHAANKHDQAAQLHHDAGEPAKAEAHEQMAQTHRQQGKELEAKAVPAKPAPKPGKMKKSEESDMSTLNGWMQKAELEKREDRMRKASLTLEEAARSGDKTALSEATRKFQKAGEKLTLAKAGILENTRSGKGQQDGIPGATSETSDSTKGTQSLPNTRPGKGEQDGIPGAEDEGGGKKPAQDLPSGEPSAPEGQDVNGGLSVPGEEGGNLEAEKSGEGSGERLPNTRSGSGQAEGIPGGKTEGEPGKLSEDDGPLGGMPTGEPGVYSERYAGLGGDNNMDTGSFTVEERGERPDDAEDDDTHVHAARSGMRKAMSGFNNPQPRAHLETQGNHAHAIMAMRARYTEDVVITPRPVEPVQKSVAAPQVTHRLVNGNLYSDASDLAVDLLMKAGGHYAGGQAPSFDNHGSVTKTLQCSMCKSAVPAYLTSCPDCGVKQTALAVLTPVSAGGELNKSATAPTGPVVLRTNLARRGEDDVYFGAKR